MKHFRRYIRFFVIGVILAALAFGSLSLRATQTESFRCSVACDEIVSPVPMPDCSHRTPCPQDKAE
ncbi:hypothetical protein J4G08_14265 [Candidatus Poribacteria bacterium]|nr:hypothetical protein [Candidatus Poribacteria bacterium]